MFRLSMSALVCVLVLCASTPAALVVLKRDAGVAFTDGAVVDNKTDPVFAAAIAFPTATGDTSLFTANPGSNGDWQNWGGALALGGGIQLYKFDLSVLPDLAGATITKAEFRLHSTGGNTTGQLGRIITHDWLEGTANGAFPGAAGGASWAHPAGYNTAGGLGPFDGTTPPLTTWGPLSDSRFSTTADGDMPRSMKGAHIGTGWMVYDVTDIVATWTAAPVAAPNYGLWLLPGNYAHQSGETGTVTEPALFLDYAPAPEPASLILLAAGGLFLRRRTRR